VVVATAIPSKYKEAPMLAKLVAAGQLPPVDERLPETPAVYPVPESIGKYGGTIRRGFTGVSDAPGPSYVNHVGLCKYNYWDIDIRPDLLESWEVNAAADTFTLKMRPGLKWSDGTPFTSEAFTWQFQNVYSDKDLTPSPGAPVMESVTAPDDHTVVVKLGTIYPLWMFFQNRSVIAAPGHYLAQFHAKLVKDKAALEKAATDGGFNTWIQYYANQANAQMNTERPDLTPWISTSPLSSELYVMERNPYFHAVDPEGNQLPYVDKIVHRLFGSPDVLNLWIANGEIDWQQRHVQIVNYTLFKEQEQKGDYKMILLKPESGGETLWPNHDAKNEKVKEFFNDVRVRKAMNLAMDRVTINEIAYDGFGVPRQASPSSIGPFYHEASAKAFIEYDPAQANKLLDEAGYDKKNADGLRLWKDGSGPVFFSIESFQAAGSASDDALNMVVNYLKAVGINCAAKLEERSLFTTRVDANEIEATWYPAGHFALVHLVWGNCYIGELTDRPWAGGWGRYYRFQLKDPAASPPPEGHWLWQCWDWWNEAEKHAELSYYVDAMNKIMDVWVEQAPVVGILGEVPYPMIVKNGLKNQLEGVLNSDRTGWESIIGTPILYWDAPEAHV